MQDSLPAAGPALPGGIGYPQGSCERFHGCNDSPFPSFLAHVGSSFRARMMNRHRISPACSITSSAILLNLSLALQTWFALPSTCVTMRTHGPSQSRVGLAGCQILARRSDTPTRATARREEPTGSTPKLAHVRQPRTMVVNPG